MNERIVLDDESFDRLSASIESPRPPTPELAALMKKIEAGIGPHGCPELGVAGQHSRSYSEDGEACVRCGAVPATCYACNTALDYVPAAQPALCGDCENVP